MADSKASLLEALQDEKVVNRFQLIFEPIFKSLLEPISQKLNENLKSMCQSIATLQKEGQEKDVKIHDLENEVSELKTIIDNHEQHGRRDSIRIFGLSEETSGTTDDKEMWLCNRRMKLDPPLTLDEISVSHRVGRIVEPTDDSPAPPKTAAGQVCNTTLKKLCYGSEKGPSPSEAAGGTRTTPTSRCRCSWATTGDTHQRWWRRRLYGGWHQNLFGWWPHQNQGKIGISSSSRKEQRENNGHMGYRCKDHDQGQSLKDYTNYHHQRTHGKGKLNMELLNHSWIVIR